MQATVRQNMKLFLGKPRKAGEIITEEELGELTPQVKTALVNQGIIDIEGMGGPAAGSVSAEAIHEAVAASFDAFREDMAKQFSALNLKIDAVLAMGGTATKPKRNKG